MKALISPNETMKYISEYQFSDGENISVLMDIPNGQRIVEVAENQFEVADPLFWVDCNSSVNTNEYYYDPSDSAIKLISDLEPPIPSE